MFLDSVRSTDGVMKSLFTAYRKGKTAVLFFWFLVHHHLKKQ